MEKKTIIAEKIHLVRILPSKEYFDHQYALADKELKLSIAQSTKHNSDKKSFKISLSVFLEYESQKIADYLYDFIFQVENLEEYVLKKEEKPLFSGILISTLLTIAYSTLRGILHTKLADTPLKDFILPIISPNELLKSKIKN
ncbi:hypothetical protein [Olivibacter domesticus]|uniref:Preprotein translocase subunit SecB n=1 Tax=Olivibacter domesticus TaxID=407022 RepID=A0A1H7GQ05_OLID1|nr:hypothetical protein [Olivibacter domesticus]SEK39082.1 hypothetical protein SAMN05661044_00127 [Olivibacter domesticus]